MKIIQILIEESSEEKKIDVGIVSIGSKITMDKEEKYCSILVEKIKEIINGRINYE